MERGQRGTAQSPVFCTAAKGRCAKNGQKENREIRFLKEEKKDLVADAANKILSAFYNGKFIHPLECDGSMYTEKIKNLIGASDEKFKQQKETMDLFAKMKSALTENNFAFYNPVCFLEK